MPEPSALFLDVGGVLVSHDNSFLFDRIASGCARRGIEHGEIAGLISESGISTGRGTLAELQQLLAQRLEYLRSYAEFLEDWSCHFAPIAANLDLLGPLSRKCRLFVLSNTNEEHWRVVCERYLDVRHFESVFLSHRMGLLKPDARIFECALSSARLGPGDVMFVDDTEENVETATRLGMRALLYKRGFDVAGALVAQRRACEGRHSSL